MSQLASLYDRRQSLDKTVPVAFTMPRKKKINLRAEQEIAKQKWRCTEGQRVDRAKDTPKKKKK